MSRSTRCVGKNRGLIVIRNPRPSHAGKIFYRLSQRHISQHEGDAFRLQRRICDDEVRDDLSTAGIFANTRRPARASSNVTSVNSILPSFTLSCFFQRGAGRTQVDTNLAQQNTCFLMPRCLLFDHAQQLMRLFEIAIVISRSAHLKKNFSMSSAA